MCNVFWSDYEQALQQAKDKAIEVKNDEQAIYFIGKENALFQSIRNGWGIKTDTIYTLDDSYKVEIIEGDTVEDGGGCFVAGSKEVAVVSKIKE